MENNTIRVLLVDDDDQDAQLTKITLGKVLDARFDVQHAGRLADAVEQLGADTFDVVLLDLGLPDSQGIETLHGIREVDQRIAVVVLTGLRDEEATVDLLRRGAQDYLVKGTISSDVLSRSIRYAIHRQENHDEIRCLLNQLQESGQLLEKKNHRLAELYDMAHKFVDNVSHEFRTPLTVIKEYASLVGEGVLGQINEQQRKYLDTIADRADDLNTMVDDMLDISKIEAGLLGAWRKNCRVEEILEYVRPDLARKAAIKGVTFETDFDENLPDVYCDDEKVGRIIINLTINAIKFCGDPGRVRLWAKNAPESSGIVIGVTDNGPGIDEAGVAAIFERFKQLNTKVRGSCKGFGLGLSIAKELVDLNFGEMNVESSLGAGSTFSFTLPIAQPVEVMRRYLQGIARVGDGSAAVSLIVGHIDEAVDAAEADRVDSFLNHLLGKDELLFRVDDFKWLYILPQPETELAAFFARVAEARDDLNRNRPIGQLPQIGLRSEGTWFVADHTEEILAHIDSSTECSEAQVCLV